MKRYLGIMVGPAVFRGIPMGRRSFEHLPFYEEAGEIYGVIPCYFRFEDIDPDEEFVDAYVKSKEGGYQLETIPKPAVIHNRVFTGKPEQRKKMMELKEEGIIFFNEHNRFRKLKVNKILLKEPSLHPHVPETLRASEENVKRMMKKHRELIIKPDSGTLGIGIAKLSKMEGGDWEMTWREKDTLKTECFSKTFSPRLRDLLAGRNMIIQERIPLAESKGRIFDLRVSVQKNWKGDWQLTGIVGKVAKKGWYLTNVARGSSCVPFDELMKGLPHLEEETVYKRVKALTIGAAMQLEKKLPCLADLGFDIGIRDDGFPMIIECNCRELRYAFRNAGMMEEWKNTHMSPVGYGRYLMDQ
ncbi:YheC/YheD family protein [Lysinibacillus sphaericus]